MARLTPVSHRQFVERLRMLGFEGPYAGGRHPQMRRGDTTLIIPNPHEGDIGVGFLRRLLSQAGVSREEWLGGGVTHLNSADTFLPVRHAVAAHLDLTHLQLVKDSFADETLQELFF